jgi:ATPase components of various ABC-type transport systems, contain duplicated ATPase
MTVQGSLQATPSPNGNARSDKPLLELINVRKTFKRRGDTPLVAVNDVSLSVGYGETVALVGESGSGKSTLGRIALCLMSIDQGEVRLADQRLNMLSRTELRTARLPMQPIFQDPTSSFNPRRTVQQLLNQAMVKTPVEQRIDRSIDLLDKVGLKGGHGLLSRFPHELSGGQRQRLAIARALAMDPRLIIADEPLSGADVSIRGQVLNLLSDLQDANGIAYLMITHDISIARAFAHRVAVMERGRIVETGPAAEVLSKPEHPYTRRLVAAVPSLEFNQAR